MQTAVADQTEALALVAKEHQVFTEETHLAHRVFEELRKRSDRYPVAAQELAAGRSRPYLRPARVRFRRFHEMSLLRAHRDRGDHHLGAHRFVDHAVFQGY